MEDPRIIAAVIAGIVSLIASILGAVVTLLSIKKKLDAQKTEMDLKKQEIENVQKELSVDIEALRQSLFSQVLSKRLESYPKLWEINIRYETNWVLENKRKDGAWASEYLISLNEFNLKHGLFISQDLYSKFADLRSLLHSICESTTKDEAVHQEQAYKARLLVYGSNGNPGLSTYIKDDLGSYRNVFIQKRGDSHA